MKFVVAMLLITGATAMPERIESKIDVPSKLEDNSQCEQHTVCSERASREKDLVRYVGWRVTG